MAASPPDLVTRPRAQRPAPVQGGRPSSSEAGPRGRRLALGRAAALLAALAVTATAVVVRLLPAEDVATSSVRQEQDVSTAGRLDTGPGMPSAARVESRAGTTEPVSEVRSPPARSATASASRIPESGDGHFDIASGSSIAVGEGDLVTYSVEVEAGLPFAAAGVARTVDRVVADSRGWTAVAPRSLQRVPSAAPTYRIRLASPETADALCAPLDTGGRLSCRNGEMVVLNAWRWAYGAPAYGTDLAGYRTYMVNHELGHALGHGHQACPEPQGPAPVMMQQTKGLDGCLANPWPSEG